MHALNTTIGPNESDENKKALSPAQRQKLSRKKRRDKQRRLDIWIDIRTDAVCIDGLCLLTGHNRKKIIEDALEMYWKSQGYPLKKEDGKLGFLPVVEHKLRD